MTYIHNVGKKWQNDLTIISKPHANSHTMKKTYAKFQNDRYKTVRGVAPEEIPIVCILRVKND